MTPSKTITVKIYRKGGTCFIPVPKGTGTKARHINREPLCMPV